jgi:hypothetical protein
MTVRRQMEVFSVLPCKGCTPWQGLLLAGKGAYSMTVCGEHNSENGWSFLRRQQPKRRLRGFVCNYKAEGALRT